MYGWDQLQLLIGLHEPAYNAFVPSSMATTLPVQISDGGTMSIDGFIAEMADEFVRRGIVPIPPAPTDPAGPGSIGDEDPALHARIDLLRDLVHEHPDMLWLDARHSWNVGDLDRMLEIRPGLPKAILMRLETLLRLGRSKAVLATLETTIEDLPWSGGNDPYRVARLLHHDRAARLQAKLGVIPCGTRPLDPRRTSSESSVAAEQRALVEAKQ